jgi:hypothetical protein
MILSALGATTTNFSFVESRRSEDSDRFEWPWSEADVNRISGKVDFKHSLTTAFLNFLARTMKIQWVCLKDQLPKLSFFYFEKLLTQNSV